MGGTRVSPGLNVSLRPVRRGILLWMELFLAVEEEEEEEEVCDELSFLGMVERVGVELICCPLILSRTKGDLFGDSMTGPPEGVFRPDRAFSLVEEGSMVFCLRGVCDDD